MTEYDKVTQASMNSLYVKAQELDRGHSETAAPEVHAPGVVAGQGGCSAPNEHDVETRASEWASDAESHASDDSSE